MINRIVRTSYILALMLMLFSGAFTQDSGSKKRKAFRIAGNVTVSIAKSTAKAGVETVKFAGRHVVVPAVKNVGVPIAKATPGLAKGAAKLAVRGFKKAIDALSDEDGDEDRTGEGAPVSN